MDYRHKPSRGGQYWMRKGVGFESDLTVHQAERWRDRGAVAQGMRAAPCRAPRITSVHQPRRDRVEIQVFRASPNVARVIPHVISEGRSIH
jgi:hypothetical protein